MRFWLITVGEPLPFAGSTARSWRTGLLAEELRARGHSVVWWTSTVDHFSKRFFVENNRLENVSPGLDLQFLHGRLYRKNISIDRFLNHLEIAREFHRLSSEHTSPDLILASYPTIELCDEAVRYGKQRGVPVLLDIRDLWPDEIAARMPPLMRPLAPILLWPLYRSARRALANATGIVAISRTYQRWARKFGRRSACPADLWAPLGYKKIQMVAQHPANVEASLRARGVDPTRRIVWFCGTFVGSIDLGTAIEAARLMRDDSSVQFVFTGSGERDGEWRRQARSFPNVVFTGWAGRDEIAWLSAQAWVGLGAYKRDALMSLPNKLFEYMSAGLPILCSLDGEARELIEQYQIGLPYRAGDALDLVARVRQLAADEELHGRLVANALATFEQHFSADILYRNFADHLELCAREGNKHRDIAAKSGSSVSDIVVVSAGGGGGVPMSGVQNECSNANELP